MRFSLFRQQIESRLKQAQSRPKLRGKRLRVESLEERRLLAGDTSVSSAQMDVNHDGYVTPMDALMIISDLNRNGARSISTAAGAGGETNGLRSLNLMTADAAAGANTSFDVNNDGYISPIDALLVIKQLNEQAAQISITLQVTDTAGNPVSQLVVGQKFELRAFVQDVRAGVSQPGVFGAYTDVTYNSALASVQKIVHTAAQDSDPSPPVYNYGNGTAGDFATANLLNEVGGFQTGGSPLGAGNVLLFAVEMTATAGGTLTFTADPADVLPLHDSLVFDPVGTVPTDAITYGTVSVNITSLPTITAAPVQVAEGNSGTTALTYTLQLSGDNDVPVTVHYSTSDGTASSVGPNQDFLPVNDTVATFPAHTSSIQITINVNGDTLDELNETLSLNLFNATGATVGTPSVLGTIVNDDSPPVVTIGDTSATEGTALSGTTPMTFTVSLSAPSSKTITVGYSVVAGTATFGNDYTGTTGVVTFLPGEVSKPIVVDIVRDALNELNETLQVNLTGASNATLGATASATGTIVDDDAAPTLTVSDAAATELAAGTSNMVFNVALSGPSGQTVTVAYTTTPISATANLDYVTAAGVLTFLPGETTKSVTVLVNADGETEQNETLNLVLSTPTNASIADGTGQGTINDFVGDKIVRIRLEATDLNDNSISSVLGGALFKLRAFVEDLRQPPSGNSGVFAAYMDVAFDAGQLVGVGPITYGPEYQNVPSGSLTTGEFDEIGATATSIPTPVGPGEHLLFSVIVQGIAGGSGTFTPDPAELLGHSVLLYGSGEAVPVGQIQYLGTGPIEISAPSLLTIDSPTIVEGNSGQKNLTYTVTLTSPVDAPVSVNYTTVNGTATAGSDYQFVASTLQFAPNQTTATITVPIFGDLLNEANETFNVQLSAAVNAIIQTGVGVGTIVNDDVAPTITISGASAIEGVNNASFQVSLSAASGQVITIQYATASQTATDGVDYTHTAGTLVFQPGETTKTIVVNVALDDVWEGAETFLLNLFSPTVVTQGTFQAVGTITELAGSYLNGYVYTDITPNGIREAGEVGIAGVLITLVGTDFFGRAVNRQAFTNADGLYEFNGVTAGWYTISEFAPTYIVDGVESIGTLGGSNPSNDVFSLVVNSGVSGLNYNFGEGGIDPFLFWTTQFT